MESTIHLTLCVLLQAANQNSLKFINELRVPYRHRISYNNDEYKRQKERKCFTGSCTQNSTVN